MLPAFATIDDLDARLPAGVSGPDDARAQAALDDASALIRSQAGRSWVTDDELDDDIPDIIRTICVRAALRCFINPDGVTQEGAGPFNRSFANASSDVYLTAAEKAQVRAAAGKGGLWTQPTTRGDVADCGDLAEYDGTCYVEVEGSELFPLLASDS